MPRTEFTLVGHGGCPILCGRYSARTRESIEDRKGWDQMRPRKFCPAHSASSATPSFPSRYLSAYLESPSSRAAWLLLPLARRRASLIMLSSHSSSVMPPGSKLSAVVKPPAAPAL